MREYLCFDRYSAGPVNTTTSTTSEEVTPIKLLPELEHILPVADNNSERQDETTV